MASSFSISAFCVMLFAAHAAEPSRDWFAEGNGVGTAEERWVGFVREHPVEADWLLQDLGQGVLGLLKPAEAAGTRRELARLCGLDEREAAEGAEEFWQAWIALRKERRLARLKQPLAQWGGLAFTEGHTVHMSFIGYTEGLSDARAERFFRPGARLMKLDFPDPAGVGEASLLIEDPHGMMRDVDVSFDLGRIAFAWKKSDRLDDYHLYEYELAGGTLRQITRGLGRADYEPMYLPCGDLIFASTRPEQSVPCWWTEISNLYRIRADGSGIERLAIDQVHTLYPQLMSDGRLTYTRWDYNDRGQNYPHPLFVMRPDGTDQRAFYGANSWFPNSLLHARGIPGTGRVMAIAAGHHTLQQGKLVMIDPEEGRDEGLGMHFLAPRREVPYERVDRAMQDGDLFRYPYPISEAECFVSYKPAWGMAGFGLYWMSADGSRELLHVPADGLEVARMVPLGYRPGVEQLPEAVDRSRNTGTYYVHDVYQGTGLEGVPRGEAKAIRVVRLDYRAAGVGQTNNSGEGGGSLNSGPVAVANGTWDVKQILGDADIHPDGSALFEVPAMESIYLQVLDGRGQVIQTTRSWDTLRPGETKGCAGCHDKSNGNFHPFREEETDAWRHGVQRLRPFYGETRGFSFSREIQPILDAKCTSCHDGSRDGVSDLRGEPVAGDNLNKRHWSRSYLHLLDARMDGNRNYTAVPEEGLVRWISKMSRPTELPPYFAGSARSPLMEMLSAGHEGVVLTTEEMHKFAAWIDLLVPFSGDYREAGAWSERDHAYYGYYEAKRGWHRLEERACGGGEDDGPMPASAHAEYREVLGRTAFAVSGGAERLLTEHEPVVLDRVWLRLREKAEGDLAVSLHAPEQPGALAGAVLPADGREVCVRLERPVRSDVLRLAGLAEDAPSVILERAHGLGLGEIPQVDGYHPYFGRSLNDR